MSAPRTLLCGFCAKTQHEVKMLIAGPTTFICNECVDLCHDIVHEKAGAARTAPPPMAPGSYGCHEALHLAHVFAVVIDQHLRGHLAIERNPDWAKLADAAQDALAELYQAIGREHLEARGEPAADRVCEAGAVIRLDPGWAEDVATPDADVGFVFTRLGATFTGLSVEIAVGDDAPLVIAEPRQLDAAATAALRHWVVRHARTLAAHWRDESGSVDLVERLRAEQQS